MISDILSPYLIAIVAAWLGSHAIKYVISLIKNERSRFRTYLFVSGGMPSAHSATAVAVTTVIGLRDSISSGLFGLAILFSLIVMYDAVKVRRSSGEQGLAIKSLIESHDSKINIPRIAKGHTPVEVVFGALLGLIIGAVVYLSTI